MKPLKWVFSHEPALIAGVIAAASVFFSVRYGTHTDAALQGTLGGLVLTIFGTLRNFVTSPATKALLGNAPSQLAPMADDVTYLKQFVGDAITNPSGLVGMLGEHWKQIAQAMRDLEKRVTGLVNDAPVSPGGVVFDAKPTTESGTLTASETVQGGTQAPSVPGDTVTAPVSEAPTPVAEPASQSQMDAVTELATLVP